MTARARVGVRGIAKKVYFFDFPHVPIDYYRDHLLELDRTEGVGLLSLITLAIGGVLLFLGLITHSPWTTFIGGLALFLGTLGALQGLFDVVVYLADPETGAFVVRRYVVSVQ